MLKLFFSGMRDAFDLIGVIVLALICFVALLAGAVLIGLGVPVVCEAVGVFGLLMYALDVVLLIIFFQAIDFKHLEGSLFVRVSKFIGQFLLGTILLAIANVVLWALGYFILWIFGIHLAIGTAACVGLGVLVLALLIWEFCHYIRNTPKAKHIERLMKSLGFVIVVVLLVLLVVVIMLFVF